MNKKLFLLIILIFAFVLRFYSLSSRPFGFTPDEASFGYDAYSLLKTGKDQWGHSWPLVLESFGDFKAPLYAYLTIPFVWLLGLSKFSVRLPNAFLGSLSVFVTYLLVFELIKIYKPRKNIEINVQNAALFAALFLAINPWHVMMSRGAFEANLTTFFLPLGIYLFIKGLKNSKLLISGVFVLGLNLFSYHSAKLVTPLVLFSLIFVFFRELKQLRSKTLTIASIVFGTFFLLNVYTFFVGAGTRAIDVNIFKGSLQASSGERFVDIMNGFPQVLAKIFHNKFQIGIKRFAANYFQYLSPQFLFTQGPAEGTYGMIPGRGVLFWIGIPVILGTLAFFFSRRLNKVFIPILVWLVIAPIPAALSTGPGYAANRAVIMLPAIQIFLSFGAAFLLEYFNRSISTKLKKIAGVVLLVIFSYSFFLFIDDYFIQSPYKIAKDMLYGNLETSYWLSSNIASNENVIVSTKLSEPHIYIAFANTWDPSLYQQETKYWVYKDLNLGWVDQLPEYKLGNYTFKPVDWKNISGEEFVIGKPEEFPDGYSNGSAVYFPNGDPAIIIVSPENVLYAYKNL